MKFFFFSSLFLFLRIGFAQSELTNANDDCRYILAWSCDECTFNWTGDCIDQLPSGNGILTVYIEDTEIMRYEGGMENGKFEGEGIYHDGMNDWQGMFKNGNFMSTRNSMIDTTFFNTTAEWEQKNLVTKQIDNFYFTFPSAGYAFDHREIYVQKCLNAIQENSKIIGVPVFKEFTKIRFVDSKKDMLLYANFFTGGGIADIWTRSIYMMISDDGEVNSSEVVKAPITHECMHMVSMTAWGKPPQNNEWLNEGLATYAANDCSGYSVAEMYRYFLENNMLLSIDSLTHNFYQTEEMVGYHQSGYIVEHMISTYGLPKFEKLWKGGFSGFESIYGFPYSQMEEDLNKQILTLYPVSPTIDWETFKEAGCK